MTITLDEAMITGRGTERPFNCPEHDDSSASASVNVEKGVWVCYACLAHGTIKGYAPSADDVKRMLDREDETARVYPEAWLDGFDADHPAAYWSERYGVDVARNHRCGTHPWTGHPTYPLRDAAGRVLGVVERQDGEAKQRYKYPYGTSTSHCLYGWERRAGQAAVLLVEGASDAMALEGPAHAPALVLGTYGAGLHYPQAQMIRSLNPKVVLTGFDDDVAGHKAHERACKQLAGHPVRRVLWSPYGGSDPGDIPDIETRWLAVTDVLAKR